MRNIAWLAVALLAGCDYSVSRIHSWSEEVDTGNGRTILVDRKAQVGASNAASPDSGKEAGPLWVISFKVDFASLPAWDEALVPMLLYQDPATSRWTANLYIDGYGDMPKSPISAAAKSEARKRAGMPASLREIRREVRLDCGET